MDSRAVKEFAKKLCDIRKSKGEKTKVKSYVIPKEFKAHYVGINGECDYDCRMYEEIHSYGISYLHYIESSGLAPVMPDGYASCFSMFWDCSALTSLDLSNFDTSQVIDMSYMFNGCAALTSLDLSNFDTSRVTGMSYMFCGCASLITLDLSSFDTYRVIDMYDMFYGCVSLTSLDLSNFDTSQVTDMSDMFNGCASLTSLDLSTFTSK